MCVCCVIVFPGRIWEPLLPCRLKFLRSAPCRGWQDKDQQCYLRYLYNLLDVRHRKSLIECLSFLRSQVIQCLIVAEDENH
ncbi:hypothetical protein JD844_027450 [Phrynosoma platyrhinos]|uniref:Uncharacterized protein n=1 Tax=Phrynosoma platyrhinos TaxID=52577 RepID=A0ABQ7SGG9_PHRPL|nr:hypothetical protein JD844_027450 [Phrynosoma platyrhinos]